MAIKFYLKNITWTLLSKLTSSAKGRKTFLSAECASDPSLNPYIYKPVFPHDVIDQNTTRTGYTNRHLVCPEIEYKDETNLVKYVIQTPVTYKIEDCDYGKNITDLITLYRKDLIKNGKGAFI